MMTTDEERQNASTFTMTTEPPPEPPPFELQTGPVRFYPPVSTGDMFVMGGVLTTILLICAGFASAVLLCAAHGGPYICR